MTQVLDNLDVDKLNYRVGLSKVRPPLYVSLELVSLCLVVLCYNSTHTFYSHEKKKLFYETSVRESFFHIAGQTFMVS